MVYGNFIEQLTLHQTLAYKISIYKIKHYIKVYNKHNFDKFDTIATKKSRKNIIDTRFNEKSNRLKVEIFQSTYQINTNINKLTLFTVQGSKHYATNILVRVSKKKSLSIIKIYNPSKNLLSKYTKETGGYKIATLINNIVKKLANTCEL